MISSSPSVQGSTTAPVSPRLTGGQSKFSVARAAKIVSAVEHGVFLGIAAESVGISRWTLNRWRQRGEQELARASEFVDYPDVLVADIVDAAEAGGDELEQVFSRPCVEPFERAEWQFVLLMHLLKRAQAQAARVAIEGIYRQGAEGKWTASAWWLERTHPAEYGRHRPYATVNDPDALLPGEQVKVSTDRELLERLRRFKEQRGLISEGRDSCPSESCAFCT